MITISREIMNQIRRSCIADDRYFMHVLKRISKKVQDCILALCAPEVSDTEAYTMFLFFMEDGLDNFPIKRDMPSDYWSQIETVNPDLFDFVTLCAFTRACRLTTLVVLYRIYESELEVRSL